VAKYVGRTRHRRGAGGAGEALHHLLSFQSLPRGFKTWEEITHSYDKIAKAYGIKHVWQMAASVDRDKKTVKLATAPCSL